MKKIAVLPTLLTLGNGICGLVSIAFASKITPETALAVNEANFAWAGWFILFGMVFDVLDGYVARLSKTASDFGGELDSLCDVVTFGVTPAFLLLKLGPGWEPSAFLHQVVAGIAALYFACASIRLARFNVENNPDPGSHKRFRGLPSPGAAGCIAALAILRGEFVAALDTRLNIDQEAARVLIIKAVEILAPIGALVVALLMVSNVPYPHLTGKILRGKRHIGHLIQVLLAGIILLMFRSLAPLLVFWIYAFVFPMRSLVVRNLRPDTNAEPPKMDEHAPPQV
ncbi:MAG: CDP-diacylglycerol--serine O-phosphatidyltransferase [Planctomycetes bacterium]|nr:CDP-diacylglycerol--serine O-phosphatidyltransferase [Planctomycetota bacterium]